MEGKIINIYMNSGKYKNYLGEVEWVNAEIDVKIIAETEKAYKIERFVSYKNKAYQVWVPKAALRPTTSGDGEYDSTHYGMEKWFETKLTGFDAWFYGIN